MRGGPPGAGGYRIILFKLQGHYPGQFSLGNDPAISGCSRDKNHPSLLLVLLASRIWSVLDNNLVALEVSA